MSNLLPYLKVYKYDRDGPSYRASDVNDVAIGFILAENYFLRRLHSMATDLEKAEEKIDQMTKVYSSKIDEFLEMEKNLVEHTRRTSGTVRDSTEKLAQSLARVEKAANFDRLEKYVELLERTAVAMKALADLEEDGKLSKISNALKRD